MGLVVRQASRRTGMFAPAMAGLNVANLHVSVGLGVLVLQERIGQNGGTTAVSVAGLALTVAGVMALMRERSPAPQGQPGPSPQFGSAGPSAAVPP